MKAVIFDMDGLMFDTESIFIKAWDYAGERIGIGKAGYMTIKTLGMNSDLTRDTWNKEFGDSYNEEDLWRHTKFFLNKFYEDNKVPVKKGLFQLLEYLKDHGFKLAVASSSSKNTVERHLKDTGIYDLFQAIICGDMVEQSKPDPEIYLMACLQLGESPEDCYALEDSSNGLISACEAGCRAIFVPDLWNGNEEIRRMMFAEFSSLNGFRDYLMSNDPDVY